MKRLSKQLISFILLAFINFSFVNNIFALKNAASIQTNLNSYNYTAAKKEIEKHDVISFDIFDTLLVRPYANPDDLFVHLKKLQNRCNFTKNHPGGNGSELEKIILQPHTENVELFNYAKSKGKRIIIVSDMHLHSDFLAEVLKKNGVSGWEKIYVSGDIGLDKHSGKLFDYVLKDLKVKPSSILHIGDNLHSDGKMSQSRGIDYFYTPKLIDRLFAKYPRFKKYYQKNQNDLTTSMFVGLASLNMLKHSDDYWYNFGYMYGGPLVYTYTKWLLGEFKKDEIKDVMFVARDGYNLQKIFDLIKGDSVIKSHYFYGTRKIANKYLNCSEQEKLGFRKYMDSLNIGSKDVACVDSRSDNYTSFKFLKAYLPHHNITGYFYCNSGIQKPPGPRRRFSEKALHTMRNWDLMEFFMSAPTFPIIDVINNQPVYKKPTIQEQERIKAMIPMYKGILDFAVDSEKSFKGVQLCADPNQADNFSNILFNTVTKEDKKHLDKIKSASNNNNYEPLFKAYESSHR